MIRREFIKDIGITAGLISVFPWLYSCSNKARDEIKGNRARLGIIGTGSRGQYHINLIQNSSINSIAEIVALCDNYAPNLQIAAELCPQAKTFTDYRQMLEMSGLDGVIIATPLNEHTHITIDALNAGIHTFCEKSMDLTLDGCLNMYNTYKESGKVLFIGQQRLYDPKYLKAIDMIHSGVIGDVTGMRCYWFRNANWRRPVPDPSLERKINWRLYKEYSHGVMTELAAHQLQVGNWVLKMIPETVMGRGNIVFWKDGREVYDTVSLVYGYSNGVNMTYESLISNKFNGLEEQILGHKGTMELEKGKYYFEDGVQPAPGILQLINDVEHGLFDHITPAGKSWVPEIAAKYRGMNVLDNVSSTSGASMIGADNDGTEQLVEAFCHSVITGKPVENLVEEAYYSSILAILGIQAMEEQRIVTFPNEYKISYLNFA